MEGYQTGADDYILKPFNINLLIARCNNLIKSRKLLQEKFKQSNNNVNIQSLATNDIDKNILEKIMEVIENNMDNPDFTINAFAQEMGMARTNLFNKIKATTGQTPNNLILNTRLKKSITLLVEHPELNISEIADMVGFSSIAYYSKCFKDMYGESPQSCPRRSWQPARPCQRWWHRYYTGPAGWRSRRRPGYRSFRYRTALHNQQADADLVSWYHTLL